VGARKRAIADTKGVRFVLSKTRLMKGACLLALSVALALSAMAGAQAPATGTQVQPGGTQAQTGTQVQTGTQSPGSGQPPHRSGCSLHLEITDEDGKALPKAFVMVHGEHGSNQPLNPDKTGQVKTSLHAGMYDLFISASGFEPQAQILDLRSCKPVDLNLMLKIDSEHSEPEGL